MLTEKQIEKLGKVLERPVTTEDLTQAEIAMKGIRAIINSAGDNPERDGLHETPFRVYKAFMEYTKGYREDPKEHLKKTFEVDHDDIVLVKDIPYNSLCEHHFAPFYGKVHIAYIPSNKITGLSKFARLADGYANRFQVQERLTQEIADAIQEVLNPKAVAVIVEGTHYCMCGRGVKKNGAVTVTSTMRGLFRDNAAARMEVLQLLK
ncbi:GTP cyclohydrolase I [Weizmannia phage Youna2]